jgi:hypothetical protein
MLLCMTAPLERLKSYKDVVGEWKRDNVYQQAFDGIRDCREYEMRNSIPN